jgi:hypothetical protein
MCQKSPKWMLSASLFQSKTSIFHDGRDIIHAISRHKEGENDAAAVVSKVHHLAIQNKKAT